jgi:hypothetical protein
MPSIVKLKEELQGVRLRGCEAAKIAARNGILEILRGVG